jgi:hypothetical protein
VYGLGLSCKKYSSGVWNGNPTLAAKSLVPSQQFDMVRYMDQLNIDSPVRT